MARDRPFWMLLLVVMLVGGCGPTPPERPTLRIAAASDLQTALPILIAAFRHDHDIEVIPTFGASGQFMEQIKQGAPFDVFLSANRGFVDQLAEQAIVKPESVKLYAQGSLALVVNKRPAVKVEGMDDLSRPEVHKIAIANPETAPYGMAAKQAMERAKLWDVLKPKIVPAESVRQALQFVQSGNAEVAFVGRSIADVPEVVVVPLPLDVSDPILQALGIVARSEHPEEARSFVEFLLSDVGQGILRDRGFHRVVNANEPKGSN